MALVRSWLFLLLMTPAASGATERSPDIQQEIRKLGLTSNRWDRADGLPARAELERSSPDGLLWGSDGPNVWRFDGLTFDFIQADGKPFVVPDTELITVPDLSGGVWIGLLKDGIIHWSADKVISYGPKNGLPKGVAVHHISAGVSGRIAAGTGDGLYELRGDKWTPQSAEIFAGKQIDGLVETADGWWIAAESGVFHADANWKNIVSIMKFDGENAFSGLFKHPDGSTWLWRYGGTKNVCRLAREPVCHQLDGAIYPIFDRDGALWWNSDRGLRRIPADLIGGDGENLTQAGDNLFVPKAEQLAAAPEGGIWALSESRLYRIKHSPFQALATPTGGIVADGNDMWVASYGRGLLKLGSSGSKPMRVARAVDGTLWADDPKIAPASSLEGHEEAKPATVIVSERMSGTGESLVRVDRTKDGEIWTATIMPAMLARTRNGITREVPLPEIRRNAVIRGMVVDASGSVWLGVARDPVGLYRLTGDKWTPMAQVTKDLDLPLALTTLAIDSNNRVWVGLAANRIAVIQDDKVRQLTERDGLNVGRQITFLASSNGMWIAGQRGLGLWQNDKFHPICPGVEGALGRVTGMVEEPSGTLWLNSSDGILRIAPSEWRRAIKDAGYRAGFTRYDFNDGVDFPPIDGAPYPTTARTQDGQLWFATHGTLYRVDPKALPPEGDIPRVVFRSLVGDGKAIDTTSTPILPVGTSRIEVNWSALGMPLPIHSLFRYRLTGVADDWVETGASRQVVFHRLDPGKYTLEVMASGRNGTWPDSGQALSFKIMPAFYQTAWAKIVFALIVLSLIGLVYRYRANQIRQKAAAQADARIAERERIARGLHDTLLQGAQSLLLTFQSVVNRLEEKSPLRTQLDNALAQAEGVIKEGRDQVQALRTAYSDTTHLADDLKGYAETLSAQVDIAFNVEVFGIVRPLECLPYEDILHIGREGMQNAFRHSGASKISVELHYAPKSFTLKITDNGVGISKDVLAGAQPSGHWGLVGMRERAASLGGTLKITGAPGEGTTLILEVKAEGLYEKTKAV